MSKPEYTIFFQKNYNKVIINWYFVFVYFVCFTIQNSFIAFFSVVIYAEAVIWKMNAILCAKMDIEKFRAHCLTVKGATELQPFVNPNILPFKVMGKMFAYINVAPKDEIFRANLKCEPEKSMELREKYEGIANTDFKTPLWNLVTLESDVPNSKIVELIQHSAEEVIKTLPKYKQKEYFDL